jgi:hypothetical protein
LPSAEAEASTLRPAGCVVSRLALAFALPLSPAVASTPRDFGWSVDAVVVVELLLEGCVRSWRLALAWPLPFSAPPTSRPRGLSCDGSVGVVGCELPGDCFAICAAPLSAPDASSDFVGAVDATERLHDLGK